MNTEQKTKEAAAKIGTVVRDYVRDRFTPGSLDSLDDLARFVETLTKGAISELRGTFNCKTCSKLVEVKHVNCTVCSMVGR